MLEQSPGNFGNARVPYDWYQTTSHVIITIRIANLKENDVKVTIINDALDVMCQLLDGRQFRMHFNLYKTVVVPDSNWAVDTSKLVINLKKADRKRWHSLEIIPDKNGNRPKSFIGIVSLHDAKNELNNLLSAAEFESKENSTEAITITQTRTNNPNHPEASIIEPISLDYNWYQDDKYVNIVIHVPNIKLMENRSFLFYEDDINIILTDNSLNWICNLPTAITNVTFKLYKEINSNESRYEISPCRSKIEIKLRKLVDGFWPSFVIQQNDNDDETNDDNHENNDDVVVEEETNNDDNDGEKESNETTQKRKQHEEQEKSIDDENNDVAKVDNDNDDDGGDDDDNLKPIKIARIDTEKESTTTTTANSESTIEKQQQQQQSKELTNQKNETILNAGDDNDNSNKSGKPTIINITASNINDDEQLTEA
ncbi:uncharacterized protein LOC124491948 [Dermatophagoides farinae]|uniref:CS domain-containing protein n=1 Tax=Dermatophagoides farinae TaxID=6954 RepID=A0A922L9C6_DERFA|nr:probable WRKY transcription factor protein 1 [Dermatophagoides farinae]XP_046910639.1 probable WRKY transcription factor protein 1 [Dermatophagoides farinae]XP_046910640.1 probable WRKY transcription factor protein 1 [Dermatophagoides farinae]XP_046910641.1 probable WRKY transcription factor protein 1 [Dermatophagoides farinae]XP_046910642.1 probable WRKY transcription factor protein 1 [Dermatophagoides farinae]KAH9527093.1 hypothetical protein DERF_001137 [Dermatophagoides farinae]